MLANQHIETFFAGSTFRYVVYIPGCTSRLSVVDNAFLLDIFQRYSVSSFFEYISQISWQYCSKTYGINNRKNTMLYVACIVHLRLDRYESIILCDEA